MELLEVGNNANLHSEARLLLQQQQGGSDSGQANGTVQLHEAGEKEELFGRERWT